MSDETTEKLLATMNLRLEACQKELIEATAHALFFDKKREQAEKELANRDKILHDWRHALIDVRAIAWNMFSGENRNTEIDTIIKIIDGVIR